MKPFKFFQKEIKKFNVYEEMVLGIIDYCRNNAIVPYGYSHPFTITTSEGLEHKRIVIRNVTKYNQFPLRSTIVIEYNLHIIHDNGEDTVITSTFGIDEEEYERLMERNQI
jgi:hypothetical protein